MIAMSKTAQQITYVLIKLWSPTIDKQSWELQKGWLFTLSDVIEQLTPRQFQEVFPITKEYKGRFWGARDYYTVTDWIGENVGMDNKIPNGMEFMFEYLNPDVQTAAVKAMCIIRKFHQRQTGKNMIMEFFGNSLEQQ